MVVGVAALFKVEVAAVFIAAALLASHSSSVTKSRHRSSGVGRSAETSITRELLSRAITIITVVRLMYAKVGNGVSGSSVGCGVGLGAARQAWSSGIPRGLLAIVFMGGWRWVGCCCCCCQAGDGIDGLPLAMIIMTASS